MGSSSSKDQLDQSSVNDDFVTVKAYNGERKNGKRHGRGVYLYPNGDMYDGEWRKSRKYGRGVYTYADGRRLEGYFYHDDYIGKEPNEKILKRMAKKHQIDYNPISEPNYVSVDQCEVNEQPDVKLKADGGSSRRVQSLKRTKWVREKYEIDGSTECYDSTVRARDTNGEDYLQSTKNIRRSYSMGSKTKKTCDYDIGEAVERRNSKRLRESIRRKYNLPTKERLT